MSILLFPPSRVGVPVRSIPLPHTAPPLQDTVVRAMQQLLFLNAQAALYACEDCACGVLQLARVHDPVDAATFIANQCAHTAYRAAAYTADLVALSLSDDFYRPTLIVTTPPQAGLSNRPTAAVLRFERRPTIFH